MFSFWPPLLYFIFILLSTLRLDFWLSIWTGSRRRHPADGAGAVAACRSSRGATSRRKRCCSISAARSSCFRQRAGGGASWRPACAPSSSSPCGQWRRAIRVTNLFGQHVSPAVVDRLLATRTDPPSEMRTVCVLFLDIRRLHGDDAHAARPRRRWRCSTPSSPR